MNSRYFKLLKLGIIPWEAFHKMKSEYNTAMAKCQKELPVIIDKADNGRFTYSAYEDIRQLTKGIIGENGLSIEQYHFQEGERLYLMSKVQHSGGYEEEYVSPITIDTANIGKLSKEQLVGKAITYCKRYVYCTIFGIATFERDPDGN